MIINCLYVLPFLFQTGYSTLSQNVLSASLYSDNYKCSTCTAIVDKVLEQKISFHESCSSFFSPASCPFQNNEMPTETPKISETFSVRDFCVEKGFCQVSDLKAFSGASSDLDIRVSKAYGSKGYDKIRISVISNSSIDSDIFTYREQFKYRWTSNYLNTGVVTVKPGAINTFKINNQNVDIFVPAENAGVRGVIIADPCFTSEYIVCVYQNKFQMFNHTIELLNAINSHDDTHFWMILGDNFYDQSGLPTAQWFAGLSQQTKTKILGSVPGNHDFWVNSSPQLWTKKDQQGNGFMQWYGQDVAASVGQNSPYDFTSNPDSPASADNIPSQTNYFWYNKIGNAAFIAFSGAHTYEATLPYFEEACQWASESGAETVSLLGHWNSDGSGCESDMTVGSVYAELVQLPACQPIASKLKYFVGHKHCNIIMQENVGFMVSFHIL